ncbi:hypothetical protein [Bradyrhizobium sp. Leo121]|uniref:hypothetical protein n=1 Tax=Bradyrhizobium sp. Leo121 TaxID=1571195 RepID=UPI0010289BD9|nr:hypothetical protein [Bradyrhizobium sp. Leo121]
MIELSKDGSRLITAKVSKQKDEEDSAKIHFRLKRLVIGKNQWGEDATSCVAIEGESDSYTHRDKPTIRGPAKIAYDILTQCVLDYGKDAPTTSVPRGCKAVGWRQWREACFRLGLTMTEDEHAKNKAFINAARHLKEKQWIGVSDPWVWQAR